MKNALGQSLTGVGLVIFLGFSGSRATQHEIKPGVERWPIKTSVLAGVDVSHGTVVVYADLVKLDDAPVGKNGHRPQAARIPAFTPPRWSQPGDYHIQISDNHDSQASCLIVEVPNPDPVSASRRRERPRPRALVSTADRSRSWRRPTRSGSITYCPPWDGGSSASG